MARTVVCITEAFQKPKPLTDLVIFSDLRPQIPTGDLSPYMKYCSMYAKEHQVWLVPHRFVVDNKLYLCLFDPTGSTPNTNLIFVLFFLLYFSRSSYVLK